MTETANIHGTDGDYLTVVVPQMIALRELIGADTPKGHRLSNAAEQLKHYRKAKGEQKANLERSLRRTIKELTD
jgi:hypothetical protein